MAPLAQAVFVAPAGEIGVGQIIEDDLFSQGKQGLGLLGQPGLHLGSPGRQAVRQAVEDIVGKIPEIGAQQLSQGADVLGPDRRLALAAGVQQPADDQQGGQLDLGRAEVQVCENLGKTQFLPGFQGHRLPAQGAALAGGQGGQVHRFPLGRRGRLPGGPAEFLLAQQAGVMSGQGFQVRRRRGQGGLPEIEGLDAVGQFLPFAGGNLQGPQVEQDALPGPPGGAHRLDELMITIDLGGAPIMLADGADKHSPSLPKAERPCQGKNDEKVFF